MINYTRNNSHKGEDVLHNTCANKILVNKSNKNNYFKGVTVQNY